jgi:hypothetical protein
MRMGNPTLTELIVFALAAATGSGFLAAWDIHAHLRGTRKQLLACDALLELEGRLRPLAGELGRRLEGGSAGERWQEPGSGTAARWQLRGADPIVFATHDVENLWLARLELRIANAPVHEAYEELRRAAGVFSHLEVANRRAAARELLARVQDLQAATTAAQRRKRRPRALTLRRRSARRAAAGACSSESSTQD